MRKRHESNVYTATIYGEPASKANSRKVVQIGGKIRVIKSKKALRYLKAFYQQCPRRDEPFEDDVAVGIRVYYKTRRPDLDESLILDALQDYAYKNDRQVKAKYIRHALDKEKPRSEIVVAPIDRIAEVVSIIEHIAPDGAPKLVLAQGAL